MTRFFVLLFALLISVLAMACGETVADEPTISEPTFLLFYTDG